MIALLLQASPVAQAVLLVLAVLLYLTLWHIFRKRRMLRRYEADCRAFEDDFWSGAELGGLLARVQAGEYGEQGLAQIFRAGQVEFMKAHNADAVSAGGGVGGVGNKNELIIEGTRRAMQAAIQHEEEMLNRQMLFLATVAGVSPYIGLLGTVWGIINAFQSLSQSSQATVALVAPGIAEALVATAMGLLAAIPALVAYNYFTGRLERLAGKFDTFANHYLNILHRNMI